MYIYDKEKEQIIVAAELYLEKSLEKKFVDLDFSKHATWTYLPRLSTCLGSPLVSFLQILQDLSTQPSSTYCPSTRISTKPRISKENICIHEM